MIVSFAFFGLLAALCLASLLCIGAIVLRLRSTQNATFTWLIVGLEKSLFGVEEKTRHTKVKFQFNLFSLILLMTICAFVAGVSRGTGVHPFLVLWATLFLFGPWTALLASTIVRIRYPYAERRAFWTSIAILIFVAVAYSVISCATYRDYALPLPVLAWATALAWPAMTFLYFLLRPLLSVEVCEETDLRLMRRQVETCRQRFKRRAAYFFYVHLAALVSAISIYCAHLFDPVEFFEKQEKAQEVALYQREVNNMRRLLMPKSRDVFAIRDVGIERNQVVRLTLHGTEVADDQLALLANSNRFCTLKSLELRDTFTTNDGLRHLTRLPNLTYLKIYGMTLSDVGIEHLSECVNLKIVYVDGMCVSKHEIARRNAAIVARRKREIASTWVTDSEQREPLRKTDGGTSQTKSTTDERTGNGNPVMPIVPIPIIKVEFPNIDVDERS